MSLLKHGAKFIFTTDVEAVVRTLPSELFAPPVLVFPDWDAVADVSRTFWPHCDASVDGFTFSRSLYVLHSFMSLLSSRVSPRLVFLFFVFVAMPLHVISFFVFVFRLYLWLV